MIQSICVYGFMTISFFLLLQTATKKIHNGQISTYIIPLFPLRFSLAILIFAFFAGVRWDVGIDHLTYLSEYLSLQQNGFTRREDFEPAYIALQQLLVSLHAPFYIYFGIVAALQIILASAFLKNERYLLPFFWFLVMTDGIFFSWMNIMRQTLAGAGMLCLLSASLEKRRWLYFCTGMFFLSFIHKSAIIIMPLCLLFFLKLEKLTISRTIQYILLFAAIIISTMNVWRDMIAMVDSIFQFIGYDERFNTAQLENLEVRNMNFGGRQILSLLLNLIIIAYSPLLRKIYPNKKFGLAYILFIVFYVTHYLFMSNMTFSRIANQFLPFRAVIMAYLLYYLFHIRRTKNNILIGLLIISICCIQLLASIYLDEGHHTDCIRYMFFWDHFYV